MRDFAGSGFSDVAMVCPNMESLQIRDQLLRGEPRSWSCSPGSSFFILFRHTAAVQ